MTNVFFSVGLNLLFYPFFSNSTALKCNKIAITLYIEYLCSWINHAASWPLDTAQQQHCCAPGPIIVNLCHSKAMTWRCVWKILRRMSGAQSSLLEGISDNDLDRSSSSSQEGSTENLTLKPSVARRRAGLQEVENVYITVSLFFFF